MSGKFTDVMKAAKDERQKLVKDDRQVASKDEVQKVAEDEIVNVCIKVPKSVRKRWTLAATEADMTLKDWLLEAAKQHWGK